MSIHVSHVTPLLKISLCIKSENARWPGHIYPQLQVFYVEPFQDNLLNLFENFSSFVHADTVRANLQTMPEAVKVRIDVRETMFVILMDRIPNFLKNRVLCCWYGQK